MSSCFCFRKKQKKSFTFCTLVRFEVHRKIFRFLFYCRSDKYCITVHNYLDSKPRVFPFNKRTFLNESKIFVLEFSINHGDLSLSEGERKRKSSYVMKSRAASYYNSITINPTDKNDWYLSSTKKCRLQDMRMMFLRSAFSRFVTLSLNAILLFRYLFTLLIRSRDNWPVNRQRVDCITQPITSSYRTLDSRTAHSSQLYMMITMLVFRKHRIFDHIVT